MSQSKTNISDKMNEMKNKYSKPSLNKKKILI